MRTDGIGRGSRKKGTKRKNDNSRGSFNKNNNDNSNSDTNNDDVTGAGNKKNPRMREGRDEVGENNGKYGEKSIFFYTVKAVDWLYGRLRKWI